MILVAGIPDESPVRFVIDALEETGAHFRVLDQRRVATADITLDIGAAAGGGLDGRLRLDDEQIALRDISAVYLRVMDDQLLPQIAPLPADAPERRHARRFHDLLLQWTDIAMGRVLNRPGRMASNMSKPYQAQTIRTAGFHIPDTLITNDPAAARDFIERAWAGGGAVIYKSISGVRSIVRKVSTGDLPRLERIRWCPTQFQEMVEGTDVRVHVVGSAVLATAIVSDATDYRYAARDIGVEPVIELVELDAPVRAACIALAARFELPLAGIDLRRTRDGSFVCFEVNPSPAFSFYERRAGVPIASAIARYLAGDAD